MRDVAIAAVVFLVAMARSLADGFGLSDESWFLQVLARVAAGDVLYREVGIGVTPLSVYVTSWATAFTGLEIVAVKLVTNACFATTAFMRCWVRRPRESWSLSQNPKSQAPNPKGKSRGYGSSLPIAAGYPRWRVTPRWRCPTAAVA